jgi:hypothetical protein
MTQAALSRGEKRGLNVDSIKFARPANAWAD